MFNVVGDVSVCYTILKFFQVSGNLRKESKANKPVAFPYPSSSSLSHEIRFDDGSQAELTCVVTIPDVYRREKSVTIEKDSSNVVTPISDYYNVHPTFISSGKIFFYFIDIYQKS